VKGASRGWAGSVLSGLEAYAEVMALPTAGMNAVATTPFTLMTTGRG
jgi:hypothetical protein